MSIYQMMLHFTLEWAMFSLSIGVDIKMYDSLRIAEIMESILNYTSAVDSELRNSLRDGLSSQQIDDYIQNMSIQIPSEVEELYKWHDGMNDESRWENQRVLLYYHYFLPFSESLDIYYTWVKNRANEDLRLFPIFEFENEFYATSCSSTKQNSSPIYNVYGGSTIAYDSLKTMLMSILECYESGAYQIGSDRWDLEIDEERAAEIKLRWNPCRNTELSLFDHP
ncbi:MAG: hypothetical protein HC921_19875 [Synechococcaceae cyanobacterium SM2_3_1]|nr:hypothetical protein [Synechococcaceae cyanobacterium SM2_3_1]